MPDPSTSWKAPPAVLVVFAVPVIALVAVFATRVVAGPSDVGTVEATANAVVIKNFAFVPAKLTLRSGTVLKVKNADGVVHTLTARDHSFDTRSLRAGATTSVTPARLGAIAYYCRIHNFMTATLEVIR